MTCLETIGKNITAFKFSASFFLNLKEQSKDIARIILDSALVIFQLICESLLLILVLIYEDFYGKD